MGKSLNTWKTILSKAAYEQLERKLQEKNSNQAPVTVTVNECNFVNEPLAAEKVARFKSKVVISIHSKRNRLIDIDNLFAKYFIDGIRYAGVLQDDSTKFIEKIVHTQEKSKLEETIITIEEI